MTSLIAESVSFVSVSAVEGKSGSIEFVSSLVGNISDRGVSFMSVEGVLKYCWALFVLW